MKRNYISIKKWQAVTAHNMLSLVITKSLGYTWKYCLLTSLWEDKEDYDLISLLSIAALTLFS